MVIKGDQVPVLQEEVLYRPKEVLQLFQNELVNNTTPRLSDGIECAPFRKFGIYVYIDSTSTPDQLHIEVEFLDRWTGQWYTHKQGLFASLYYEDTDTASGIYECFVGDVLGRAFRVKLTGVDVSQSGNTLSSTKYFTVSIGVDFWN
jgi:hypothetical protein